MQYSREISETGIEFDTGSVYARLGKLTDIRKDKGKRYSLTTLLMIILMAKLCGEDTVMGIADWAKNRKTKLVEILGLKRTTMPNHNTYRRLLAYAVYQEEIERMVGEHNQEGGHGEIYALDGKAIRGARKKDEPTSEYVLSIYDVQQGKVMSQVAVGRKENEISKASETLHLVNISGKVLTADAMHTQKRLSTQVLEGRGEFVFPVKENQEKLYKSIQSLFAPEYPKPGFGKIPTDFQSAQKVNKGHGRLEIRTIQTSEMLNSYSDWPGLAQVYRLERVIQWWYAGRCYLPRLSLELQVYRVKKQAHFI
jgi:predicted transposase YbfD/YdcC